MTELMACQEKWLNFQSLVNSCKDLVRSEIPQSKLQVTTLYSEITTYFEQEFLSTSEREIPAVIQNKMRSYITEIHRLLKILQREIIFWHSAKQDLVRAERRLQVLDKFESITRFTQSMIKELTISIDL